MKDKMILITQIAIGLLVIALLVFWGLDGSVWRDASRADSIIFILYPPMIMALLTILGIAIWKKRRVDKGLEQWPAKGEVSRTLETLLRVISIIVLFGIVILFVVGIVFQNHELSFGAGTALAGGVVACIMGVRAERAKKREQREKEDAEDTEE